MLAPAGECERSTLISSSSLIHQSSFWAGELKTRGKLLYYVAEKHIFVWSLQGVPAIIQGGKDVGFKVPVGP